MGNFNHIYKSILTEGRIPSIFKKATPEELAERKVQYGKIQIDEWVENFLKRKDIRKNKDGSWDVDGNVGFAGLPLPVRLRMVKGYLCCNNSGLKSFKNFPVTVGGDFIADFNLFESLEHCPREVGGNFSCYQGYGRNRFTIGEVRAHCIVKGRITV